MIACLYSGGKDSTLALHRAVEQKIKPGLLITFVSENPYSYMFHRPDVEFTSLQAEALGIEHVFAKTKGEKEKELVDLEYALKENNVSTLITGAVASTYQRSRIQSLCDKLGIRHVALIWGIDPLKELKEIAAKYEAIIIGVSAQGFDETLLGARIDEDIIKKLLELQERHKINLSFEGGEAESFVLKAPLFKKKIIIKRAHKVWTGTAGTFIIDDAYLE